MSKRSLGGIAAAVAILVSPQRAIPAQALIGQNVVVSVEAGDGSLRFINGYVGRFSQTDGDEREGRVRTEREMTRRWARG